MLLLFIACKKDEPEVLRNYTIDSIFVNNTYAPNNSIIYGIDYRKQEFTIIFNDAVDTLKFWKRSFYISGGIDSSYNYKFSNDKKKLFIEPNIPLVPLEGYRVTFNQGPMLGGLINENYSFVLRTQIDSSFKFPLLTDDELLTHVQYHTFKYFWDYAHPTSGLIRERNGSNDLVTSGGSGFGLMAILVGIERNFITRQQGFERLNKIVSFLNRPETDKFHGAFPHWLNGSTGKVIPFSLKDNGGDLVETAFLMQGLLTVKEYFKNGSVEEQSMCSTIDSLYRNVKWSWYRKNNENVLYWHWSPNYGWDMNHTIRGWNEALIVYVLAAGSPTYPIPLTVYQEGWARNGTYPMVNNRSFYGIQLPLGYDYGGPLFFAHYSFLGLDPRNLSDQYANYWNQNVAHTQINRAHCIANPRARIGYSADCWGLSASDIQDGYTASSPTNDVGVIAPTAAISSIPYTPQESMRALKFFYYVLGDKIWGEYGFYDSFNLSTLWYARSYLAIDQGPIICMIENYRSGLLWELFMENQYVQSGLNSLQISFRK